MKRIVLMLIFIMILTALYSDKSYRILSRWSVRDNSTNLVWARCMLTDGDKPIHDINCNGTRKLYTWSDAIKACENLVIDGRSDWRLPNIRELQSIIYYRHQTDSDNCGQINSNAFPGVVLAVECNKTSPAVQYWSSTPHHNDPTNYAWYVDFNFGNTGFAASTSSKYVRCVAGP